MDGAPLAIRVICRSVCFLLIACSATAYGADGRLDGRQLAQDLQGNVVRVKGLGTGFGFIVAQQQSQVFIVTANHVVRDIRGKSEPVAVNFFHDQRVDVAATLLPKFDHEHDVAVLRARLPSAVRWRKEAMGRPKDLDLGVSRLWYVGRHERWEIPSTAGFASGVDAWRVILDMRIPSGTSGAPLIAADGIVGLIYQGGLERSSAVLIDRVKDLVTGWSYPWHMTPDPRLEPLVAEAARYEGLGIYAESFWRYRDAALAGNPHAMARLGSHYLAGNGVAEDATKAREWFAKAADSGEAEGMVGLGFLYGEGMGVKKDLVRATQWFRRAAESGNVEGTFFLAVSYEKGLGVRKDLRRAIRLYEDACRLGFKPAQHKLRALGRGGCE